MAFPHTASFTIAEQNISLLCKAIAHPARLRIVSRLHAARNKGLMHPELTHDIGLTQGTISQHLLQLRQMELIQSQSLGTSTHHKINPLMLDTVDLLGAMITLANNSIDKISSEKTLEKLRRTSTSVRNLDAPEV